MQFTVTQDHLQYVGLVLSAAAAIFLAVKHFGTVKGWFSGFQVPTIGKAEDPRVCMMNDWDCLKRQLLEYTSTDIEKVDEFDVIVWETIRKIEVGE